MKKMTKIFYICRTMSFDFSTARQNSTTPPTCISMASHSFSMSLFSIQILGMICEVELFSFTDTRYSLFLSSLTSFSAIVSRRGSGTAKYQTSSHPSLLIRFLRLDKKRLSCSDPINYEKPMMTTH